MCNLTYSSRKLFVLAALALYALSGCSSGNTPSEDIPTPQQDIVVVSPTETPIVAAEPAKVILWAGPETGPSLLAEVQPVLQAQAEAMGLETEVQQSLTVESLQGDVRLVVALPPANGLMDLVAAAPQVRFVAVSVPGIVAAGNLTVIGGQGGRPDQQGFMAGYIAALVTEEWRVGVLSVSDLPASQQARAGFLTGVPFFCGLCRQEFPPFYEYPIFAEAATGAPSEQWQAAADVLLNTAVETVYLGPGITDPTVMDYLAQNGVNMIGSSYLIDSVRANWILSIQPDVVQAFTDALPRLLAGEALGDINTPLTLTDINNELLSEGRLVHIQEILGDLQLGIIATERQ